MGVLIDNEDNKEYEIEGETFVLKPLTFKEDSEVTDIGLTVDVRRRETKMDLGKMNVARLTKSIVDWSLEDEDGKKIPINEDNVGRLKTKVANELMDRVEEISGVTTEELKK